MTTTQLQRMSMGCGYEPRADDRVHLTVWQPPSGSAGYQGEDLTTCAGYTCNLPDVGETALARVHWGKGNASVLGLTEDGLNAIVILEGQHNQLQAWLMTDEKDGGGRRGS
jgi:hypothetical protein